MTGSIADRSPSLDQLIRADDLRRTVEAFLGGVVRSVYVFQKSGASFISVAPEEVAPSWSTIPAEALVAEREGSETFFVAGAACYHRAPLYAGADRVGTAVYEVSEDAETSSVARMVAGLSQMLGTLLQGGFATWVTSELHRAASEESFVALERQNLELQRAVAHLRELDQLKSNFLATVSHELRTPLTSVIGFADMLLKEIAGPLNEEQRDYTATILERGEDLYALISQILDLSRIEVGELPLDIKSSALDEIVERAVRSVDIIARRAEITIRVDVQTTLENVRADPRRIQQVLVNLLSNGIKFQDRRGEIIVTIERSPLRRPCEETFFGEEVADALKVSVRDEGPGLTPEQCERVFDAFYQVDATSTRSHGGAGLGLSIVEKLIHAHGGEVWAESSPGEGANFQFTLPLVDLPEGSPWADLRFG